MLLLISISLISFLVRGTTANIRNGRCPSPQYVSSGLSCSTEGDDSVCPWNYKCCPLTDGMRCFHACPEFAQPCELECPFGLKVEPSPCTVCECAPDPCLTTTCPLGTKCTTKEYEPCAIKGRCGLTTKCITDTSIHVDPTPKPKNCPTFWPTNGGDLRTCNGPDALCPGAQKCCQSPLTNYFDPSGSTVSYCVEPCEDLSNCTLQCGHGLIIDGGCRVCKCAPNPCDSVKCAADEKCKLLPPPCAYYPGRPPCSMVPVCMKSN